MNKSPAVGVQVWIYKGRRAEDEMYRAMWVRAMDEMLRKLLFKNEESGYTYVAEFARCSLQFPIICPNTLNHDTLNPTICHAPAMH